MGPARAATLQSKTWRLFYCISITRGAFHLCRLGFRFCPAESACLSKRPTCSGCVCAHLLSCAALESVIFRGHRPPDPVSRSGLGWVRWSGQEPGLTATHVKVRKLNCPEKHGPARLAWLQHLFAEMQDWNVPKAGDPNARSSGVELSTLPPTNMAAHGSL